MPPWICPDAAIVSSLWSGALANKNEWRQELGTRVVVMKRSDLSVVIDSRVHPAFSYYHSVNAYDEDGQIRLQIAVHNGSREAVEANFRDMYHSVWTDETRC